MLAAVDTAVVVNRENSADKFSRFQNEFHF